MKSKKNETIKTPLSGLAECIEGKKSTRQQRRYFLVGVMILASCVDAVATSVGFPGAGSSLALWNAGAVQSWQPTGQVIVVLVVRAAFLVAGLVCLSRSDIAVWKKDCLGRDSNPMRRGIAGVALAIIAANLLILILDVSAIGTTWRFAFVLAIIAVASLAVRRMLMLCKTMPAYRPVVLGGSICVLGTITIGTSITKVLGVGDHYPIWEGQIPLLSLWDTLLTTVVIGGPAWCWITNTSEPLSIVIDPQCEETSTLHSGEVSVTGELLPALRIRFTETYWDSTVAIGRFTPEFHVCLPGQEFDLTDDLRWVNLAAFQRNVKGTTKIQDGAGVVTALVSYSTRFDKPDPASSLRLLSSDAVAKFFRHIVNNPDIDQIVSRALNRQLSDRVFEKFDNGSTSGSASSVDDLIEDQTISLIGALDVELPDIDGLDDQIESERTLIRDFIPMALETMRMRRLRNEIEWHRARQAPIERSRVEVHRVLVRGGELLNEMLIRGEVDRDLRYLSDLIHFEVCADPSDVVLTDRFRELRQQRIDRFEAAQARCRELEQQVVTMHRDVIQHAREDIVAARRISNKLRTICLKGLLTDNAVTAQVEQADSNFLADMLKRMLRDPQSSVSGPPFIPGDLDSNEPQSNRSNGEERHPEDHLRQQFSVVNDDRQAT